MLLQNNQKVKLKVKSMYDKKGITKKNKIDLRYTDIGTYEFLLSNQRYASYKLSFTIKTEYEIRLLNTFFSIIDIDLLRLEYVRLLFAKLTLDKFIQLVDSKEFIKLKKFVKKHAKTPLFFDKGIDKIYRENKDMNRLLKNKEESGLSKSTVPYVKELDISGNFNLFEEIGKVVLGKITFQKFLASKVPIK